MVLLVGALTVGLILALLALGVFVSFRIFEFPDITADGSMTLGAAVAAVLIVHGYSPLGGDRRRVLAGRPGRQDDRPLNTRFGINGLLSGILVATALYSVNLHVMGKSNVPLLDARTVRSDLAEHAGARLAGPVGDLHLLGWELRSATRSMLAAIASPVAGRRLVLLDALLPDGASGPRCGRPATTPG